MRTFLAAPLLVALTLAPNYTPVDVWESDWESRVQVQELSPSMLSEWQRIHDLYPWWIPKPPEVEPHRGMGTNVEQWRTLVEQHFQPADVSWAMRVIKCESGGNPNAANPTSSARGLWQHLRGWYSGDWGGTGVFDPFDPEQSMKAGAWLFYNGGPQHWNASRHCWGS